MDVSRISSIGWLNCADGSINLTPCLEGNCHPQKVNISQEEFEQVRDDTEAMKGLAAQKLGL